jgi:uncharacterized protein (TIGR00661 family)
MAFESLDEVLSFLSPFSEYRFEVFAKVKQVIHQDNITVNPLSHDEFHRQLERCSGVICNTGFELSSEALQLGKKLLTKPLDGQYEQLCNALGLQTLSRATVMTTLDKDMLSEWLTLRGHDPIDYPDVADAVANWLVQSPRQDSKNLVSSLWACFDNPCQYKEEFGPSLRENLLY